MTRPWNPRVIEGGRKASRPRLPRGWNAFRPRPRILGGRIALPRPGELRLMILAGLFLGLVAYQALHWWPAPRPIPSEPAVEAPDPWAESRLSREILERQEGPPPPAAELFEAPPAVRMLPAAPVRVIDGDTFDYAGIRIRIADIDTPELRGDCSYERDLARRASGRMAELLAAGPFELRPLPSGRDEDRYGRKLRIVTRGGASLGDRLVAEGLARTWTGRREPWCG